MTQTNPAGKQQTRRALSLALTTVALLGLAPGVQAQVTRFKTYDVDSIITADGVLKPPFKMSKVRAEEFPRFRETIKEEEAYMEGLLADYVGKKYKSCTATLYFLPGSTDSAFRASEKTLTNAVVNKGFKSSQSGGVTKLVLKKSAPVKKFAKGSVSLYLYESTRAGTSKRSVHIHAYVYSNEAKQGSLLMCSALL